MPFLSNDRGMVVSSDNTRLECIRWKAAGQPQTYSNMKCPQCGKRSWHKLSRDAQSTRDPFKK